MTVACPPARSRWKIAPRPPTGSIRWFNTASRHRAISRHGNSHPSRRDFNKQDTESSLPVGIVNDHTCSAVLPDERSRRASLSGRLRRQMANDCRGGCFSKPPATDEPTNRRSLLSPCAVAFKVDVDRGAPAAAMRRNSQRLRGRRFAASIATCLAQRPHHARGHLRLAFRAEVVDAVSGRLRSLCPLNRCNWDLRDRGILRSAADT